VKLDDLAAHAAGTMHDSVASVDTLHRLGQVPARVRGRRRTAVATLVVVAAMVVALAAWATRGPFATDVQPAGDRRGTEQPTLSAGTVRFDVPMAYPSSDLFVLTARSGLAQGAVTFYRLDGHSGLNVFEHAHAVRSDDISEADPSGGTTAREMARWIATRPFVAPTSVTRTSVGGRPAWRVVATLRPGARLTSTWDAGRIAPLLFDIPPAGSWLSGSVLGEMTLLDLPGGGVTAIWSWSNTGDLAAATADDVHAFIAQLRFG
jgi:hypothetical protein